MFMNMNSKKIVNLAEKIIDGYIPDVNEYRTILSIPDDHVFHIMAGTDLLRNTYLGESIHLCTICNGKSGRCTEDCAFCYNPFEKQSFQSKFLPTLTLDVNNELR